MKVLALMAVLSANTGAATAQDVTRCKLEYTCVNVDACQTTKTGLGVDFDFVTLPDNQLRFDLGDDSLPLLKVQQVTDDLMTAHGWDSDRSASYTFSLFADGIVAYTTHVFVGKGISLTGLGRCEVNS
ncbi:MULTISPECIES: hypothetical protein [unclassified Ruegeria]|uniref:hypothetical protein n=1 Tax=unclassified Ruegeria TaxID=2625375 RepID=UPI001489EEF2|nr:MULTISPECIES: hypothetical protein [unclassified Ruegeria]NOD75403.1 hypothetical protein [Ruegeria sp. HKCCD4332]NOD87364.1 hypothetical protein [Ruegeria sp. HKCCD4318]NOE12919.1 hypothetical protein [Ruegeria sp. HKCCD4318-2]NOG08914.1 hypothetical protein [Ruegeria sp. HKCCD4315]